MATSKVAIANLALQKLGSGSISALDQNNPDARAMNTAFDLVLGAELRRYDWVFAIKRASLPADGDDTLWGGWNRFNLPADCIRLLRDDETGQAVDWKLEGEFVVTADAAPLNIRYVARIEDPNEYDALFIEAFACKLAMQTCEKITGSTSKKESVKEDYKDAIAEARRVGAIEKSAQEFPEDSWVNARL
jgi:hypothetical protein